MNKKIKKIHRGGTSDENNNKEEYSIADLENELEEMMSAKKFAKKKSTENNIDTNNIDTNTINTNANNNNSSDKEILDKIKVNIEDITTTDQKDYKCAPDKEFKDGSCIRFEVLNNMVKEDNKQHKDNNIKEYSSAVTKFPSEYKKYLVKEFNEKLKTKSQTKWLKEKFVYNMQEDLKRELITQTFRPEGPQAKFEWLNTVNINKVMEQYEIMYDDFKFLGAVPIDFDELPSLGLKKLNFKKLQDNGINRIGVIFNLDEHYKNGS